MDNQNYVVRCINGFNARNLTREDAYRVAKDIVRQWREVGRDVKAYIYYNRTGELVEEIG